MSFLYDQLGRRKYLTISERQRFLAAARKSPPEVYTFCATLAYTGARISEILALRALRIDFSDQLVILECLKKRRLGINRAVPVPSSLLDDLNSVHALTLGNGYADQNKRLWSWSRTTAWKHVKKVMSRAQLSGPAASPKGLRHSFGVCAIQIQIPLNLVQKWLGHSRISTTAIYADAIGDEERKIARRIWETFKP